MPWQHSLRHEYELYVEREIEAYKDSVSRTVLLTIGDEAVAALAAQAQTSLTELVLWEEVDRIIARRLGLPTFAAWRRRRLKVLAELRRPERWGLAPDGALARALRAAAGEHVLVAGAVAEEATLFSAALGCTVTTLTPEPTVLERVFAAADEAGVGSQVRGCVCDLGGWAPDVPLRAVVCTADAFAPLAPTERALAICGLRDATPVGGVHVLRAVGRPTAAVTFAEWRAWYDGWAVSAEPAVPDGLEPGGAAGDVDGATFVARHVSPPPPAAEAVGVIATP
jgi:hypothetical protein